MIKHQPCSLKHLKLTILMVFLIFPAILASSNCTCEEKDHQSTSHEALKYKLISIGSILLSSGLGVCLPFWVRDISYLHPEGAAISLVKSFASGVILATGFIHILPDAFESLTSPCLGDTPFGKFPFAGFVAMLSATGTLMMESLATGYHKRTELRKANPVTCGDNEDVIIDYQHHHHVRHDNDSDNQDDHNHGSVDDGGHEIPSVAFALEMRTNSPELIRHRIVSQVLELGILVHSVIIGLSLGTSQSLKTIKPLVAALSFHQFFEGMGLGGCISQAKFKPRAVAIMVMFFSLTTPTGIAIGIYVSSNYKENSPRALAVQGILNAASAGILIYMALVDLLAADFMSSKMLNSFRLQIGSQLTLLLGAGAMSLLAKWGEHD